MSVVLDGFCFHNLHKHPILEKSLVKFLYLSHGVRIIEKYLSKMFLPQTFTHRT